MKKLTPAQAAAIKQWKADYHGAAELTHVEAMLVRDWQRALREEQDWDELHQHFAQRMCTVLARLGLPHCLDSRGMLDADAHGAALALVPFAHLREKFSLRWHCGMPNPGAARIAA